MNCKDCGKEITAYESFKERCGACHSEALEADAKEISVEELRARKMAQRKEIDDRLANASKAGLNRKISRQNKAISTQRIILTTETAHNLPVDQRLGIIAAEVVVGMNVFKDLFAGVRNIVGGRSGTIQKALRDIRMQVLEELKKEAALLGADAVVGIDLDFSEIGATGSTMLMLVANGTAVSLKSEQPD